MSPTRIKNCHNHDLIMDLTNNTSNDINERKLEIENNPKILTELNYVNFDSSFSSPISKIQEIKKNNEDDFIFQDEIRMSKRNRQQNLKRKISENFDYFLNSPLCFDSIENNDNGESENTKNNLEYSFFSEKLNIRFNKQNFFFVSINYNKIKNNGIIRNYHKESSNQLLISDKNFLLTKKEKEKKLPLKLVNTNKIKKNNRDHTIHLMTQKPNFFFEKKNEINSLVKKIVNAIIFSSEQENVLQKVKEGVSIFYTGSAGTGKSILLNSIIKYFKTKYNKGIAVTASTGLAACNIQGITLHSFAGVGLANEPLDILIKKVKKNKKAYNRWLTTKVLIIDEISMVDGYFFNKLNEIAKVIKKNNNPFGGIQLIVSGDFFQLPPVVKNNNFSTVDSKKTDPVFFAFESEAWESAIEETILLKNVFRQKGDQKFIDMLNEMRNGEISQSTIDEFKKLSRPLDCSSGISPSELFATRIEVNKSNQNRLNQLPGMIHSYSSIDSGSLPVSHRNSLLSGFLAPSILYLKKNAQVMCIKNYDDTLVNGSLGLIIDFMDKNTYLKENKSCSDDSYSDDNILNQSFEENIENNNTNKLYNTNTFNINLESVEKKIKKNNEINENNTNLYPLIKFFLPDGVNTRTVLVEPEQWVIEDEKRNILASRIQLPLILAWSISIHKSQGQTLSKVKVDLKNVFENGQTYVALSRATSRSGLQILNFDPEKVKSHYKVINFYKNIK